MEMIKPSITIELPSTSLPLHKAVVNRKIEFWALEPSVQDYLKKFSNTEVKVYTHADCLEVLLTTDKIPAAKIEIRKTVEPDYCYYNSAGYYSATVEEQLKSIVLMLADTLKDIPKWVFKPIEFGAWRKSPGVETLCSYKGFSLKVNDALDLSVLGALKMAFADLMAYHSDKIIKDTYVVVDLAYCEEEIVYINLMKDGINLAAACCTTKDGKLSAVIRNRSTDENEQFLMLVVDTIFRNMAKISVATINGVITASGNEYERTYSFRYE